MPALDALQKEKGSDRFEVMTVNVDTGDDAKPKAFLDEIGVKSLAHYRDASMDVFNDLKKRGLALGLPVTLLVDGEGCLIGHLTGPAEWEWSGHLDPATGAYVRETQESIAQEAIAK